MNRGRGRGRGGGSRGGFRGQRLRGLFADGIWQCDCNPRLPAEHFRVKKEGRNHGRWFYTCQKPEAQRCAFFLWDDEAKIREEGALINNSRTEPTSTANVGMNRYDALNEHPGNMAAPQPMHASYPTHVESGPSARLDAHRGGRNDLGNNSDGYDEDSDDWTLDETDIRRLENSITEPPGQPGLPPLPRTPVKRTYTEMSETGLPTPQTNPKKLGTIGNGERSSSKRRTTDVELLNLVSPATTPTPIRSRDVSGSADDPLFLEVKQGLSTHGVSLNADAFTELKKICSRSSLRMQGVIKGREISRLALNAKDAKLVELQRRIDTLEAELETERAIVRHLRWENEVNEE